MADWQPIDDWCRKQLAAMKPAMERHILSGGDADDPQYRLMLRELSL